MDNHIVIVEKRNHYYGLVKNLPKSVADSLYSFFTYYAPNYQFTPKYQSGIWDGKIRFYELSGKFPLGLSKEILYFIKHQKKEYRYQLKIQDGIENRIECTKESFLEVIHRYKNKKYDDILYQIVGAIKAIRNRRGVIRIATGGGKTYIAWMILAYLIEKKLINKALFITPKIQLIEQTYSEFLKFGKFTEDDIGLFYGNVKNLKSDITIASFQSINASIKKKPMLEFLNSMQCIILDECHYGLTIDSKAIRNIFRKSTGKRIPDKLEWRIGLTGTMPEHKTERVTIKSIFGSTLIDIGATKLAKAGQLAFAVIKQIVIHHTDKEVETINDMLRKLPKENIRANTKYVVEKQFLDDSKKRLKTVLKLAKIHYKSNRNLLIFVDRVEHGQNLYEQVNKIVQNGNRCFYIHGTINVKERERIRKYMDESSGNILIATYGTLQLGVDIHNIRGILVEGKSKTKVLQSIGRGLRKMKDKNKVVIFDIYDCHPKLVYSRRQRNKRIELYKKEQFEII